MLGVYEEKKTTKINGAKVLLTGVSYDPPKSTRRAFNAGIDVGLGNVAIWSTN